MEQEKSILELKQALQDCEKRQQKLQAELSRAQLSRAQVGLRSAAVELSLARQASSVLLSGSGISIQGVKRKTPRLARIAYHQHTSDSGFADAFLEMTGLPDPEAFELFFDVCIGFSSGVLPVPPPLPILLFALDLTWNTRSVSW